MRRAALWTLIAAGSSAACVRGDLVAVPTLGERIALAGEFCTGPPVDAYREVRVLFLTDSSNSMRWSDPGDLLVDAIEHITRRYSGNPDISFAVIRWGSNRAVRENVDYEPSGSDPPLFTNDPEKLGEIFARMRASPEQNPDKYLDGTNYELALREAADYVVADQARNPARQLISSYVVEFVTDGMPQSATNDAWATREAIVDSVSNLHQRYGARVDVISLAQGMVVPPEFLGLLSDMAEQGGGQYVQLASPAGLEGMFEEALAARSFLVEYEAYALYVYNRTVKLTESGDEIGLYVDSDGDGLVDHYETELGMDPGRADSDGDGLSDLFEDRLRGEFDPLAINVESLTEEGMRDEDGDLLIAYEEERLGLAPDNPDSDRDGMPDDLELALGLDPRSEDDRSDLDADLVPAGVEVREHLAPMLDEGSALRDDLAYHAGPLDEPIRHVRGRRCYAFEVGNIALGHSLPSEDAGGRPRPAGLNVIEVIAMERPALDAAAEGLLLRDALPTRQTRARRWVVLGEYGDRNPQAMTIYVRPQDFTP